ncbi:adenosylcobinamide amidohydrolase [Halorussus sp. MSC15.2]|uniref:adenosylcobinamide amidohydrolase n=1 Tax=Halorussus sp. MSC15.2 TaxID=2283638 RepID=UPI0013CF8C7B|nr:adenosylcobinamide amidohydrolase [Halorussus sp. MSC15.2]NEU57793.1 adenosylcobinamide amidohydrolase [Halorussus sp. MSC15.2]
MFETETREAVLRVGREGARWLSTGWDGGEWRADAAYNVSVPEGFDRTDLDAYLAERRRAAGFDDPGPALLTGVELRHARGARCGPVSAVATAGVSNPAALPMDPGGSRTSDPDSDATDLGSAPDSDPEIGTVNVVVGTDRALAPGALPNLLAVAVETKTATLLAETGFPGTTSDAVIAACDPAGEETTFSGSATEVGACARACVREAVRAGLESRYGDATDATIPESVADADYGTETDRRAEVFEL